MTSRFYNELVRQLQLRSTLTPRQRQHIQRYEIHPQDDVASSENTILSILSDERCKRILFDSRQAATFDALQESPPHSWQAKLHPPFEWFYLELTEPILVGEQEPGREDPLRAILYRLEAATSLAGYTKQGEQIDYKDSVTLHLSNVVFWFCNYEDNTLTDRGFLFHLPTGLAATRRLSVLTPTSDPSQMPENMSPSQWFFAGADLGIEGRYKGWYERSVMDYSALLSWMFVYMMAKGIKVVPEPVSRQQRRLYARKKVPTPWHIVKVEPHIQKGQPRENPLYHHGYRYDVMGHLRFGNHKLGDGSYRETIEWVNPHQRGLANELYVPKTSKFESGKTEHPAMRRYFTE